MSDVTEVPLAKIKIDHRAQSRERVDLHAILSYSQAYKAKDKMPPVVVFQEKPGAPFYLSWGFHRIPAAQQAGRKTIEAVVKPGGLREAIYYSAGANIENNSVRRTEADKRRAVIMILSDAEWSKETNVKIGDHCGVSESLVRAIRKELKEAALEAKKKAKERAKAKAAEAAQTNGHAPEPATASAETESTTDEGAKEEEKANEEPPTASTVQVPATDTGEFPDTLLYQDDPDDLEHLKMQELNAWRKAWRSTYRVARMVRKSSHLADVLDNRLQDQLVIARNSEIKEWEARKRKPK